MKMNQAQHETEDRRLIEHYRRTRSAGDFETIVDRLESLLMNHAMKHQFAHRAEALDAAQDAFLWLFEHIDALDAGETILNQLCRVVRSSLRRNAICPKRFKSRFTFFEEHGDNRSDTVPFEETLHETGRSCHTPANASRKKTKAVRKALEELPPRLPAGVPTAVGRRRDGRKPNLTMKSSTMTNRLPAYDVHTVFHDGHELRFIENTAGERFFVAIPLAGAAGYKAVRDVAGRHVPADHRFLVSSPDAERISGNPKTKTLTLVDLTGAETIVARSRNCTAQRTADLLKLCRAISTKSAAGTIQPPANTNKTEGPTLFDEPSPASGSALDVPGPVDENLILAQAVKIAEKRLAAANVKSYPPNYRHGLHPAHASLSSHLP